MNISVSQLAQLRPANTSAATFYTSSNILTEITGIFICNTTATPVDFRLFHDDDGTTYDQTTALYYDESIAANTTKWVDVKTLDGGLGIKPGGSIGVATGTADALNFTAYGHTANVARMG